MQPNQPITMTSTPTDAIRATRPDIICCNLIPLPGALNTYAITIPYSLGNSDVLAGFFEVARNGRIVPMPFPGGYSKDMIAEVGNAAGLSHRTPEDWKVEHAAS